MNNLWQLQDAKSRFSELVERVLTNGVQIVTRRGKKTVVLLSVEEYQRLTRSAGSLSQFLINSPLAGSELAIERSKELPRIIEFEP
ncbi:MAG: type II toxin-antitoxin system Phd/YefM family antitoxin [Anaerolineaceae bacterium]|nr:type II toxin-antitoxin system Phd/YefM family antitoxin [Anaerolineaceae bacterium]